MLPVLFKIGTFEVRSFGIALVIAFIVAVVMGIKRAPRFGVRPDQVQDMAFWTILAGVLGARVLFIVQEWGHYAQHPEEIWTIKFQGLTSFGGVLFGALAIIIWCRIRKVSISSMLDVGGAPLLVGQAIGRVGCFLNGCCYGGICTQPWGVHMDGLEGSRHPAQLYETAFLLIGLGILLRRERRPAAPGQSVALAVALFGAARFLFENWRKGVSSTYWGSLPITEAQAAALAMLVIGLVVYFWAGRHKPTMAESPA